MMVEATPRRHINSEEVGLWVARLDFVRAALNDAVHYYVFEFDAVGDNSARYAQGTYDDKSDSKRAVYEGLVIQQLDYHVPRYRTDQHAVRRVEVTLNDRAKSPYPLGQALLLKEVGQEALRRLGIVINNRAGEYSVVPTAKAALEYYRDHDLLRGTEYGDAVEETAQEIEFPIRGKLVPRLKPHGEGIIYDDMSVYAAVKYPSLEVPGAVYADRWWHELKQDVPVFL